MRGLKIVWRGGTAYAIGTVAGQRIRKSLGTGDTRQAEELRAQLEALAWKRHTYGEEAVRTFGEAAEGYQLAGGESAFLPPLIVMFGERVLGTIKPEEPREAARAIYSGAKASTWNRQAIVPMRAVINYAAGKGWCQPIRIKMFEVEKTRRRAVDRAWLDAFLARCDLDKLPHLAAAVLFMAQTGTRVGEAVRVLPHHLELRRRVVLLETTKTDAWEERHITEELLVRLANLTLTDGAPVFAYSSRFGVTNRMKAVCRRAGIPFVSPHQAGRHSFATNALAAGATVREVMDAGGWKSARMLLEIYTHTEQAGRAVADRFDQAGKPARKSKAKK